VGKIADNVRITYPPEVRNGTSEIQSRIDDYFIATIAGLTSQSCDSEQSETVSEEPSESPLCTLSAFIISLNVQHISHGNRAGI